MNLNTFDATYHSLLKDVLENGRFKMDRTGVGCYSVFGRQVRYDLSKGFFPLITTKFVSLKSIVHELLWFLKGDTNIKYLLDNGVHIWDEWALKENDFLLKTEDREYGLKESNHDLYQQYMKDIAWESCVYPNGDELLGLSDEDLSDTKTMYLDRYKAPKLRKNNLQIGDLGPVYSAPWRRLPVNSKDIILIDVRVGPTSGPVSLPKHLDEFHLLNSEYVGDFDVIQQNHGVPYQIVKDLGTFGEKNTTYLIQFLGTKFTMKVTRPQIKSKSRILDPYAVSLFGVAALGVPTTTVNRGIYDTWCNMISRCYNQNNPTYHLYGDRGVYVSPRWLCFENFVSDITKLPNYENWASNPGKFELDKDYFGSNCYSENTCLFISKEDNIELSQNPRHLKVTNPQGRTEIFFTRKEAVEVSGVSDETFRNYENKRFKNSSLDGWLIEDYVPPAGKLLRRLVYIDQISELINNLITNPFSRRHIVSAWNSDLLPVEGKPHAENIFNTKQVLPPCHTMFQFFVEELTYMERQQWAEQNLGEIGLGMRGYHRDVIMEKCDQYGVPKLRLSCQLYQRSCDIFLGASYNIASYSLLLMMVAQVTNMAVGEFIHSFGDLHAYSNHIDQINLQLTRESKELPIIKLNPEVKDIFAFQPEDIVVQFYDSHPAIKGAVAV